MKIHFSWTISPTENMVLQSRLAIAAAKDLGTCTIWVHEKDYNQINAQLKRIAEVIPYQSFSNMDLPWSSTPKWNIEPRGDVVVGCDADVMVWRKDLVLEAAKKCIEENAVCGTIGYAQPFPIEEWHSLFKDYKIPTNFDYKYTNTGLDSPYYINNGVVMMPSKMLPAFRESFYSYLPSINERYKTLYYMSQVATTIAIYKAELKVKPMPRTFNYTEVDNPGLPQLDDAIFLHHNISRNKLLTADVPAIQKRAKQLLYTKML
jgi:hypothetical protein